jgi:hypothetical protein
MSTGDLLNNTRVLLSLLRQLRYPHPLDASALSDGKVEAYLPLLHFLLSRFHTTAVKDGKFVDKCWRVMRDEFSYYPRLNKTQFLGRGFGEQKLLLIIEVVGLVRKGWQQQHKKRDVSMVVTDPDLSIMHEPLESAPRPMPAAERSYQEYSVEDALIVRIFTHEIVEP